MADEADGDLLVSSAYKFIAAFLPKVQAGNNHRTNREENADT